MSKLHVFGYGSLAASVGLSHRNLRFPAREDQFVECALSGYERSFNAVYRGWASYEDEWFETESRFFGIAPKAGARVNGVVFPLDQRDIGAFISSEGGDVVYQFLNLRSSIVGLAPGVLHEDSKVFVCVTKAPSFDGRVSQSYLDRCARALAFRSDAFKQEFGNLLDYPGAPKRPISTS